jgi:hypothetical protein
MVPGGVLLLEAPMAVEPQTKYAMGFFDGQNLFRHAKDAFKHYHPNYDPQKMHAAVCAANGWTPNLVRFYTGVPDSGVAPMWAGYWSNRILAMKRCGIHTTTRPIKYHTETVILDDETSREVIVPREKGIDVRLALDVVSCAREGQYNIAVIYSQDQDLCEVVQEVKAISIASDRWIKVACAFPDGPNATTRRGIDKTDWFRMDEAFYNACLDPHDYRPKEYQ